MHDISYYNNRYASPLQKNNNEEKSSFCACWYYVTVAAIKGSRSDWAQKPNNENIYCMTKYFEKKYILSISKPTIFSRV